MKYEDNPCYQAALKYLRRGWSALALCPPDHLGVGRAHGSICTSPGKVPIGAWKLWAHHLPTPEELRRQWHLQPNANVGIALGRVSGIVAIDVDGDQLLGLREYPHLELVPTLSFSTGRGRQYLYTLPLDGSVPLSRSYRFPSGEIAVLSDDRLTVMPPSLHRSGKHYVWDKTIRDLAVLPRCFSEGLPSRRKPQQSLLQKRHVGQEEQSIPEGNRNNTLFKLACAMRRHGALENEILAAIGEMNNRCDPPLDDREVELIGKQAVKYLPEETV